MDSRTKLIERVRKLLSLAERGGTPEESAAAAARAQAIITRHQIAEDELDAEADADRIDGAKATPVSSAARGIPMWLQHLGKETGRLCGVYVYKRRSQAWGGQWRLVAVGRDRDVEILRYLLAALIDTVTSCARSAMAEARKRGRPINGRSYREAFTTTLVRRMHAAQNSVLDELKTSARGALVPLERADQAKAAANDAQKIYAASGKGQPHTDLEAIRAGARDAERIDLPGEHDALRGQLAIGDGRREAGVGHG